MFRQTVFHLGIQTSRRELKYDDQRDIFNEVRSVWITDKTQCQGN